MKLLPENDKAADKAEPVDEKRDEDDDDTNTDDDDDDVDDDGDINHWLQLLLNNQRKLYANQRLMLKTLGVSDSKIKDI